MKNAHILCAVVWVLGLMTACKYGTDNNNTTDTLQSVVSPKNAPNIKYLQIFDSLECREAVLKLYFAVSKRMCIFAP